MIESLKIKIFPSLDFSEALFEIKTTGKLK